MTNPRRVTSIAEALHRTFIGSITTHPKQAVPRPRLIYSGLSTCPTAKTGQTRNYAQARADNVHRPPRNEEIRARTVSIVSKDNHLMAPVTLNRVLADLDLSSQVLVQVAQKDPDTPPICKILDKKDFQQSERARTKSPPKNLQNVLKQLELNWAIDNNDLGHRLDRMQQFLEKGMKVEVILAPKRRGRQATDEEAEAVLRKIRERTGQVEGAKESKQPVGKMLGMYTLSFDGRPRK
ncbi:MAG: hypothetical protein M1837_003328 [Sclerophora amabilis]|nr:MAG: hypothetical protein M1837_003328 [Sclerophora amabilis]